MYGDQLVQLRVLLDELIGDIDASGMPAEARHAAELARAEAAKPSPEPGRLRRLMDAVMNRAKDVSTVSQAVANILGIITMIEHGVR